MAGTGSLDTFEQFLANNPSQISISYLILALFLAALLSFILSKIYVRYGESLSNREKFSSNFILLTTTTTLIIMIVKSSLALSLGLVGALSIVRFRAAIKEPEELSFLFLCIAIGLGLGANQIIITLVSFVIISTLIFGRHISHKKEENQNLCLTISGQGIKLKDIINVLKKNCASVNLKRFEEGESLEASFLVDFKSLANLEKVREELQSISKSIKIFYLDKEGI
jgi:hypothetical protein